MNGSSVMSSRKRRHRDAVVGERGKSVPFARRRTLRRARRRSSNTDCRGRRGAHRCCSSSWSAAALRGDRDALDLVGRAIGKIDVDQHVARDAWRQHAADDVGRVVRSPCSQMRRLARCATVGLRQRERRNAEDGAFHRARDRAGIDHVLGDVAAAIDAGEHEVGRACPLRMWRTPMMTQSVGVPFTAKRRSSTSRSRSGSLSESECDTPDWSNSGATIHTSSDSARAISAQTSRPGANECRRRW